MARSGLSYPPDSTRTPGGTEAYRPGASVREASRAAGSPGTTGRGSRAPRRGGNALAAATHGASVRVHATRRGDGAVEIVVSTTAQFAALRPSEPSGAGEADRGGAGAEAWVKLDAPRRIVGAHGGVVVAEIRPSGERQTRVILPARIARDDELAGARHP